MKTWALLAVGLLLGGGAAAEPPPYQAQLGEWARDAGYRLSAFENCRVTEEQRFGALGSVCWSARRLTARPGGLFPRMRIILAVYRGAPEAAERMARFRQQPPGLSGEAGKSYPLRAGFQLGDRVLIVTTDAFAFEADARRIAAELARRLGGARLTCWGSCEG